MDLNDEYYKRLIYKQNALEDLALLLQTDFEEKKVFFISSKTPYQKFGTSLVNQLSRAGCEFIFKLLDNPTDSEQLDVLAQEIKNCKVIVALGGGSVCDGAKYLSKLSGLPYILVPTNPTTTGYFTPYAFIACNYLSKRTYCGFAYKIIIDENFISKANKSAIESATKFILSFWELVLNLKIDNLLFSKNINYLDIEVVLAKFKDNASLFKQASVQSKLILMDILIDLGYLIMDLDAQMLSAISLSMLLKSSMAIKLSSFGAVCITACRMLMESYKKFFSFKKVDVYAFLNLESLATNLSFLKADIQNVKLDKIKNIRQNKQLFLKLNAVKYQISSLIEKSLKETDFIESEKENAAVDLQRCIMTFNVFPYIADSSPLSNILSCSGLII